VRLARQTVHFLQRNLVHLVVDLPRRKRIKEDDVMEA